MSARPSAERGGRVRRTTSGLSRHTLYACRYRIMVQETGGDIAHPLDDIGQAEHCLLACKAFRQVFQDFGQRPDLLLRNGFRLAQ